MSEIAYNKGGVVRHLFISGSGKTYNIPDMDSESVIPYLEKKFNMKIPYLRQWYSDGYLWTDFGLHNIIMREKKHE